MFKLIKILNSGRNVPEPIKVGKLELEEYTDGTPVVLSDGKIAPCTATATPTHITVGKARGGEASAFCALITPDMIFETYINADPAEIFIGSKVTLGMDSGARPVCVTATVASGVATVVDTLGAKSAGDRVLVKF